MPPRANKDQPTAHGTRGAEESKTGCRHGPKRHNPAQLKLGAKSRLGYGADARECQQLPGTLAIRHGPPEPMNSTERPHAGQRAKTRLNAPPHRIPYGQACQKKDTRDTSHSRGAVESAHESRGVASAGNLLGPNIEEGQARQRTGGRSVDHADGQAQPQPEPVNLSRQESRERLNPCNAYALSGCSQEGRFQNGGHAGVFCPGGP